MFSLDQMVELSILWSQQVFSLFTSERYNEIVSEDQSFKHLVSLEFKSWLNWELVVSNKNSNESNSNRKPTPPIRFIQYLP